MNLNYISGYFLFQLFDLVGIIGDCCIKVGILVNLFFKVFFCYDCSFNVYWIFFIFSYFVVKFNIRVVSQYLDF